jgi:hypothetical protein
MNTRAARLRLGMRLQRLRHALGVIEPVASTINGITIVSCQKLGMQHGGSVGGQRRFCAHALAPFKI